MDAGHQLDGYSAGAVFEAALDAVIVMGSDGRVVDWNDAAEAMFGHARDRALGRTVAELLVPERYRERHRQGLADQLAAGGPVGRRMELSALHADGRELPVELTVTRVPGVDPPLFVGFVRDLSGVRAAMAERERLERRLAFLAEAGAVLDASLDLGETLERLSLLPVPGMCDVCVIDVLQDGGAIVPVGVAAIDERWAESLRSVREHSPLDPAGPHPVATVLRDGRSLLLPAMTRDFLTSIAGGEEHRELMHRLHYRSAIVTPLFARGRVHGALSILRVSENAPYDGDDLTLAEELARRAAIAVDNARLYEATRHVAVTLQETLLPHSLPDLPGARLLASYRAASEAQQVGGDFYDAFALADGGFGLVIGDVCGKGPEAAALTALARFTIRGTASRDPDPEVVLRVLNDTVRREQADSGRFLTAIFAAARPEGGRLRVSLACGGHPRPLLARADGTTEPVAAAGSLIGIYAEIRLDTVEVSLDPGDTLVLYTDGITDAGAPDRILSEDDLAELIAAAGDREPETIAGVLERTALSFGPPRDDIALLLVSCSPGPVMTRTLP